MYVYATYLMSKTSESDPTGPFSCFDVGGGGLKSQESAAVPRKQRAHNPTGEPLPTENPPRWGRCSRTDMTAVGTFSL